MLQKRNEISPVSRGYCKQEKIDVIKGVLILLVIIGHILPGQLQENFVRYFIYSFHMPVFFAVSGYLVNIDRLRESNASQFCKKYGARVVIPWLIAIQVYYILNCALSFNSVSLKMYLSQYIYPFYHLWYVIGFMFCVCSLRLIEKIYKDNNKRLAIFFLIISIILGVSFEVVPYIIQNGIIGRLINIVVYSVRPQYLMFFSLGLCMKLTRPNIRDRIALAGIIIFAVAECVLFAIDSGIAVELDVIKWLLSLMVILLLYIYREGEISGRPFLKFCGVNSFPIYLWHIIGKQIALYITADSYNVIYYILCVLWCILLFAFIKQTSSNKSILIKLLSGV